MPSVNEMRYLGIIEGRQCYWGDPGLVDPPGFYYYEDLKLKHVPLPAVIPKEVKYDPTKAYTEDELIYAAYVRCKCGAGMAYIKGCGAFSAWMCSAQLKHEVPDEEFEVLASTHMFEIEIEGWPHTPALFFQFWNIKSDQQPSANGATTRGTIIKPASTEEPKK